MNPADYRVIDGGFSGAQIVPEDTTWPSTDDEPDAVRITFEADYESAESPADSPPENVVQPLKQAAQHRYRSKAWHHSTALKTG